MADYKTIHGTTVKNYTNDPDNPIEGQIWYDETAATLQYQIPNVTSSGSFRTGNAMNTARRQGAGAGIQTSALAFGGETPGAFGVANNESYDGTSWTEVADLNTARNTLAGSGASNTSALAFTGADGAPATGNLTSINESWNGSTWTETTDLNTARVYAAGFGTNTAALCVAGGLATAVTNITETWNGTSWTEVGDTNTSKWVARGAGTNTDGLISGGTNFGGDTPVNATETWNGSAWTEVAN